MAFTRSLSELANVISSQANSIYDTYNSENIPQPSFEYGTMHYAGPYTKALEESRAELLEAVDELRSLIIGPAGHVFFMSFMGPAWTSTLHVLYKFEIAKHVPLGGSISYTDLADRCGLPKSQTRRYVRSAISFRVFCEPSQGMVQHNAVSTILATSTLHDWLGIATEELAPAALKVAESMQTYPAADKPAESAFALANGSIGDNDLFSIVGSQPERMARFSSAMEWSMKVPGMEPPYTVEHLGWNDVKNTDTSRCPRVVVDVGGGTGTLVKAILEACPNIEKAIVEDLPQVVTQVATDSLHRHLAGRLEYHSYDFFTEQTIKDADVYIWRCVFHDWPDSYAAMILRNQIPALKPGARMILLERCLEPPKPFGHVSDQFAMSCDIMMQICANGKERSRDDWTALFALADKRFDIESITTPPHSALSIIQVVWRGGTAAQANRISDESSLRDRGSDNGTRDDSYSTFGLDSSSESEYNYSHKRAKTSDVKNDATECTSSDSIQPTGSRSYIPSGLRSGNRTYPVSAYTNEYHTTLRRRAKERKKKRSVRTKFPHC